MARAGRGAARLFGLDDAGWARHANPLSGWSRFASLPLLALAVWSRVWIGWWALLPVGLALAWTWANPRAFPPPRSDRAWMTRAVLGERLWTRADELGLAVDGRRLGLGAAVGVVGVPIFAWGLWALDPAATVLGILVIVAGKLAFVRRTARLYDDAVATWPELRYRPPD